MAQIPGSAYSFKNISTSNNLPLGTYQCQIEQTGIATSQKGDTYLTFTLRVLYGTEANRKHTVCYCHECVSAPTAEKKKQREARGRRQTKLLGLALGYGNDFVLTDTDQYLNKTCEMTISESNNPDFPNASFAPWSPGTAMATPTTPVKQTPQAEETFTASDDDVPW
jgi:hypothetical protein